MSSFRVMQFNMQFGQTWDAEHPDSAPVRIEDTIAEIRRFKPDIVFLQELEHAGNPLAWSASPPNYSALRAALPEYDSVFAVPDKDPRELPFGLGLAIFSKTPLKGLVRHVLPSPPIPFEFKGRSLTPTDRIMITATTELQGCTLRLFNVHLLAFFMLGSSSREHPEQRLKVLDRLGRSQYSTLLAGDFNVVGHDDLARQFGELGYHTVQTQTPTWRRCPFVLDHIFHDATLRCEGVGVEPTLASDHHILIADFSLQ